MDTAVLDRPTTDYERVAESELEKGRQLLEDGKRLLENGKRQLEEASRNLKYYGNGYNSNNSSYEDDEDEKYNPLNDDVLASTRTSTSFDGIIKSLEDLRNKAYSDRMRNDIDRVLKQAKSMIAQGKTVEVYDYVNRELKRIRNNMDSGLYNGGGYTPTTPTSPRTPTITKPSGFDPFSGDSIGGRDDPYGTGIGEDPDIGSKPDTNKPDTSPLTNKDPYGFDYSKSSDIELIKKYIKGDIPLFLHGLSGCGKSGRIKAIDPDCVIVYLASAKPETMSGKSVLVNGELKDVPPEWYKKICKLCEDEPDKDHILFLDEITNAPPSLQGLAYNVVLDKDLAGKWKLPPNCKVVAAGNDMDESIAASQIAEPLFRRFAHINIETTVPEWIVWASEKGLHPAVIAFIASNGLDKNPVFRTKCDGKNPCVDPRKWEMASKMLQSSNNPNDLKPLLGKDITKQFVEFAKKEVISLDQVLKGEYSPYMSKLDPDKGWRIVAALCAVDEKNVGVVVDFLKKYLYEDQFSIFKRMWTANGQDKKRVNILQEHELRTNNDKARGGR